jgi:hypothetical protein
MKVTNEKAVARLWKSGRLTSFQDDLGNEVEVICAGRDSTRPGCDFQDVVISANGEKITGDVEVHLTSDLWKKHGHHENPAYNGVILHVVMWQKGDLPVRLEAGIPLPTVILSRYIEGHNLDRFRINAGPGRCAFAGGQGARLKRIIFGSGICRFEIKAALFAEALRHDDPEQVLYKGICRALGYARNMRPFEILADRLPVSEIYRLAEGSLTQKQAILLGSAGLFPRQDTLPYPENGTSEFELERPSVCGDLYSLSTSDWCFYGVRPLNHPFRRLTYLAQLLHRYEKGGLVAAFSGIIRDAARGEARCLEGALQSPDGQILLGMGRAGEIVINQLLPFFRAHGVKQGDVALASQALCIYLNHGPTSGNELLRYMRSLLGLGKGLKASEQQGMLHIYHTFCRTKDCAACPVSTGQTPARG